MHPSTPSPDSRGDTRNDPTGRHGDVDTNGDLVDELTGETVFARIKREIEADRARQDERLRASITATSDDLAEQQLAGVRQVVRGWTVPGVCR